MKRLTTTTGSAAQWHAAIRSNDESLFKRKAVRACLLATAAVFLCGALTTLRPTTKIATAQPLSNDDVAAQYIQAINTGFSTGDFSGLAAILSPDVTLTQSNPAGKTSVFHGVQAVIDFYTNVMAVNFPGLQFTADSVHDLSDSVVLEYEHAGVPGQSVPGRCTHVFVVQNGQIVSYDWTTFFAGAP